MQQYGDKGAKRLTPEIAFFSMSLAIIRELQRQIECFVLFEECYYRL